MLNRDFPSFYFTEDSEDLLLRYKIFHQVSRTANDKIYTGTSTTQYNDTELRLQDVDKQIRTRRAQLETSTSNRDVAMPVTKLEDQVQQSFFLIFYTLIAKRDFEIY